MDTQNTQKNSGEKKVDERKAREVLVQVWRGAEAALKDVRGILKERGISVKIEDAADALATVKQVHFFKGAAGKTAKLQAHWPHEYPNLPNGKWQLNMGHREMVFKPRKDGSFAKAVADHIIKKFDEAVMSDQVERARGMLLKSYQAEAVGLHMELGIPADPLAVDDYEGPYLEATTEGLILKFRGDGPSVDESKALLRAAVEAKKPQEAAPNDQTH